MVHPKKSQGNKNRLVNNHQGISLHFQNGHEILSQLIVKPYCFHFGPTHIKDYEESKIGSFISNGC